jgi:hypothetical protein
MAFKDFPDNNEGRKARRAFYETDDGIELIEHWRRQGLKVEQIAEDCIGVSKYTFQKWRKENPRMQKALDVAIEICNANVEKTLYKKAIGFYYEEEIKELVEGELMTTKVARRYCPPDTKAIMHWLFSRMPERWRSVQEPIENTQLQDNISNILVAMKEVAEQGNQQQIDVKEIQVADE